MALIDQKGSLFCLLCGYASPFPRKPMALLAASKSCRGRDALPLCLQDNLLLLLFLMAQKASQGSKNTHILSIFYLL